MSFEPLLDWPRHALRSIEPHEAVAVFFVLALFTVVIKASNKTDIPKIEGLPELPGVPVFGSLFLLGRYHARNCACLAKEYGAVFQARLGNRRFIYANTFDSVRELWIKNQSSLISRPKFWTFHTVVSSTQGVFTLGTSPWNDSVKRARKAAASALNRQAVQTYLPFIDLESTASINELFQDAKREANIDPNGYFQRFSLNISLTLNYGIRLDGSVRNDQLKEVVAVERELSNYRGIAHNWQDYVPIMRLWPGFKRRAKEFRGRRDEYILTFLEELKRRIANGTDHPCIAGNVLKDPETKLADNELKSICLTMVAAGLDTLPGNINMTIAYLSSEHGQELQAQMHHELIKSYPDEDPWHACLTEEKSEYMRCFVKEVLRYWSTLNLSFGRESTKPITYDGATIPAGTPFLMNTWAANHDPAHFTHPMRFYPERFMGVDEAGAGTQHYAYGAGTRSCPGIHIANRELYVIFTRMILAFHILPTDETRSRPILDTIECNAVPTSMITQPKPFKVNFLPREDKKLQTWIDESLATTEHL